MKILRLEVDYFRSLREITWEPGYLNILIGPNGSGKSNLLKVLELLSAAASGGLTDFVRSEGGMQSIVWDGRREDFRAQVDMALSDPLPEELRKAVADSWQHEYDLTYDLYLAQVQKTGMGAVSREKLYSREQLYYLTGGGTEERAEGGLVFARTPSQIEFFSTSTGQEPKLTRLTPGPGQAENPEESVLSTPFGDFQGAAEAAALASDLKNWCICRDFGTARDDPARQAAVTRHDSVLSGSGENLVTLLHTLYTNDRDFEEEVDQAMRAAFGASFEKLVFPPAGEQRIQLGIRWKDLKRPQGAPDLSDGTLRFLYLVAALAVPDPPPLIAIDEPEAGLHPSMFPIVAELAAQAATRTQVVLTTHSPDFLDAFRGMDVTTTVTECKEGETQVRNLSGETLDYWLKQYSLGELFRSGELETME